MSIRTLAVHLDEAGDLTRFAPLAARLARTLQAQLLGIATATVKPLITSASLTLNLLEARERDLTALLARLEGHLRAQAKDAPIDWRSAITDDPTGFLLRQAVLADLLLVEHRPEDAPTLSRIDLGRLVLGAGRPALILPPHMDWLELDRVLVAYKPVREGRAALKAALPVLRLARRVLVAGVGDEAPAADLADAADYLRRHEVEVETRHLNEPYESIGSALLKLAEDDGSHLLVSGAYGRGRARELLFGGVTRELLSRAALPCLLAH